MSHEASMWALNLAPIPLDTGGRGPAKPSSACAFVLVGLANHADNDGRGAFPAVRTLVRYTRLSERTVRTALDRLEAEGVIRRCDPAVVAGKIDRPDRRPTGYDLAVERVRDDLDGNDLDAIARSAPMLRPLIEQVRARGATTAPRDGVQPLHPAEQRGATDDTYGVQPAQARGAAVAPEQSLNSPRNPTTAPADAVAEGKAVDAALTDGKAVPAARAERIRAVLPEAHSLQRRFHAWWATQRAPITGAPRAAIAVRNLIAEAVVDGYTFDECRRALANGTDPFPSKVQWQRALAEVRSGRPANVHRLPARNRHVGEQSADEAAALAERFGE